MITPTKTEQRAIESMRRKGFALAVFNPTEIGDANASNVEDVMVERGWNAIADQTGQDADQLAAATN